MIRHSSVTLKRRSCINNERDGFFIVLLYCLRQKQRTVRAARISSTTDYRLCKKVQVIDLLMFCLLVMALLKLVNSCQYFIWARNPYSQNHHCIHIHMQWWNVTRCIYANIVPKNNLEAVYLHFTGIFSFHATLLLLFFRTESCSCGTYPCPGPSWDCKQGTSSLPGWNEPAVRARHKVALVSGGLWAGRQCYSLTCTSLFQ